VIPPSNHHRIPNIVYGYVSVYYTIYTIITIFLYYYSWCTQIRENSCSNRENPVGIKIIMKNIKTNNKKENYVTNTYKIKTTVVVVVYKKEKNPFSKRA